VLPQSYNDVRVWLTHLSILEHVVASMACWFPNVDTISEMLPITHAHGWTYLQTDAQILRQCSQHHHRLWHRTFGRRCPRYATSVLLPLPYTTACRVEDATILISICVGCSWLETSGLHSVVVTGPLLAYCVCVLVY
jgi:hypothetical protein